MFIFLIEKDTMNIIASFSLALGCLRSLLNDTFHARTLKTGEHLRWKISSTVFVNPKSLDGLKNYQRATTNY